MDKVKEILLADFKRANNVRKVKLATKYGLTVEEYLNWLNTEDIVNTLIVENTEVTTGVKPTDIVIAFDTTGSMYSYINNVKNHITNLIPELFNNTNNLRIGIVAFGDYCDMKSKDVFGNAYQVLDLSEDTSSIISFVKNAKDTSGGDSDEFYELVIKKIQEETSWREGSNKSILLVGDYPNKVINISRNTDKNFPMDIVEERYPEEYEQFLKNPYYVAPFMEHNMELDLYFKKDKLVNKRRTDWHPVR